MASTVQLYNAAYSAADTLGVLNGPDTAYLLTAGYTFTATDTLAVPLGYRSIQTGTSKPVPALPFTPAWLDLSAFPVYYDVGTLVWSNLSSPDVTGVVLAVSATGQPFAFLGLGATFTPAADTLEVTVPAHLHVVTVT